MYIEYANTTYSKQSKQFLFSVSNEAIKCYKGDRIPELDYRNESQVVECPIRVFQCVHMRALILQAGT